MKTLTKYFFLITLVLTGSTLWAQEVPAPGAPQEIPIILRNALIHPGNGSKAFKGDILIMDGKIQKIGEVRETFKRSEDIDAQLLGRPAEVHFTKEQLEIKPLS